MSGLYFILLFIHTSLALNLKLNQPSIDYVTFEDSEDKRSIDDFMLLSTNRPTKLNLRDCQTCDTDVRMQAIIERPGSSCLFPVFGWEDATRHIKLWSMGKQLEILQVIKIFDDPKNNSMDLFVMNMGSCEFTKTEILKGYDYFTAGGAFIVFEPENTDYFDVFSLDGIKECGTRVCRRVYDIKKREISPPMKFSLLEDEFKDWQLTFMAASKDYGYFAIIRSNDAQIKLLSVNSDAEILNSSDDSAESKVQFLKMSTYHGEFGFCYTLDDDEDKAVHCMQLDDNLNLLANVTHEIGYKPSFLAVHNLPSASGLLVLTARCDTTLDCSEHEMLVTKLDGKGGNSEVAKFKDDGCAPRNQQQFNFYEENGKVCVFYACDMIVEEGNIMKTVRYRCF